MSKKEKPKQVSVFADSLEAIADNVARISDLGNVVKNSRLTKRAITVLLHDMTRVSARDIDTILNALPDLEKRYLK